MESTNVKETTGDQRLVIPACLNCGSDTPANFCANCGQSAATVRYTFRVLANEIYSKFRSIDALAALHTFHALCVRPGEYVQEYLSGKRVGFTNPIAYFFFYFVLEVFTLAFLQWATGDHGYGKQGTGGLHVQIVTLVTTIFWGVLWWIFFRRSNLNLIENAIAAIYFVAQVNIFSLFFLIASAPLAHHYPLLQDLIYAVEALLYIVYGLAFCRKLSRDPFWILFPKQLVLSILLLLLTVIVFIADVLGSSLLNKPGP